MGYSNKKKNDLNQNMKLLFILQLLCILKGTKVYMNNTLVMLMFCSVSVCLLNTGSDTVTVPSQSCFGG